MTDLCREFEVLLSAGAAGALEPLESDRLEAHLAGCRSCRSEAEGLAEVVGLTRLAPPAEAELQALHGLQARIVASWSGSQRRRSWRRRLAVGFAVAAAAAAMVLAPGVLRRNPPTRGPTTAAAVWQEPDLDELWEQSASAVPGGYDDVPLSEESVLFAALDDAEGF